MTTINGPAAAFNSPVLGLAGSRQGPWKAWTTSRSRLRSTSTASSTEPLPTPVAGCGERVGLEPLLNPVRDRLLCILRRRLRGGLQPSGCGSRLGRVMTENFWVKDRDPERFNQVRQARVRRLTSFTQRRLSPDGGSAAVLARLARPPRVQGVAPYGCPCLGPRPHDQRALVMGRARLTSPTAATDMLREWSPDLDDDRLPMEVRRVAHSLPGTGTCWSRCAARAVHRAGECRRTHHLSRHAS